MNLIKQIISLSSGPKLSFDLKALYSNRLLQYVGSGFLGLFLPIFLFEKFNFSIKSVLLFYIIGYVLFALLVPVGAKIMSKIGLKYSMILATLFLPLYFLCFYYFEQNRLLFLGLAIFFITLSRITYWVPYHTDFAKFTNVKKLGIQIAFLGSISVLSSIAIPVLAGFIIDSFGFELLFLVASFLVLLSVIPLFLIRKVSEKYSYSYLQSFKELFRKKNRSMFLAFFSSGAESVVALVIWPIFIYQLLNGEYVAVGAISSAVILLSVVLRLIVGRATDRIPKRYLVKIGSIFYALGWVVKGFIQTASQIFMAGTYHNFATVIRGVPFEALTYEELADHGHYIDEYTVLREMALSIGRVAMLVVIFLLLDFFGLHWAFILAAVVSLFVNAL